MIMSLLLQGHVTDCEDCVSKGGGFLEKVAIVQSGKSLPVAEAC